MEQKSKKETVERLKCYKAIHASHLYKNMVKQGGKTRWEEYLKERFDVQSCTELDLNTLKDFTNGIYKKLDSGSVAGMTDGKVVSILPYIINKDLKESGTEYMTHRQSWTIKRDWGYLTQYLNPENSPEKALETYIKRVCGQDATWAKLTKKQASKMITAIKNWIKSIEG